MPTDTDPIDTSVLVFRLGTTRQEVRARRVRGGVVALIELVPRVRIRVMEDENEKSRNDAR